MATITVFRKWAEKLIQIRVSQTAEEIAMSIPVDVFINRVLDRIGNPAMKFTTAQAQAEVVKALHAVIEELKETSRETVRK